MVILLSPAKTMRAASVPGIVPALPAFLPETETLLAWLKSRTPEELARLWGCSDRLAEENRARLAQLNPRENLTPALYAYQGSVFRHLDAGTLPPEALAYLQRHLRILSALYGVLRPLDGIAPYRLEMRTKADVNGTGNLYRFWGSRLHEAVTAESRVLLNLASAEYAACIKPYLRESDRMLTVSFREQTGGKAVEKSTYAKIARGEMLRFLALNGITEPEGVRAFTGMSYRYTEALSSDAEAVFLR